MLDFLLASFLAPPVVPSQCAGTPLGAMIAHVNQGDQAWLNLLLHALANLATAMLLSNRECFTGKIGCKGSA